MGSLLQLYNIYRRTQVIKLDISAFDYALIQRSFPDMSRSASLERLDTSYDKGDTGSFVVY